MSSQLKSSVVGGVAWSFAEKVGSTLFQIVVSLITLRMLMPQDFGVVAMLAIFSTISLVVVDSGFSQTLIRKAMPSDDDYKSVFVFNVAISIVLYLLMILAAFPLAKFYNTPQLVGLAPIFFLQLPAGALCVIQNTILSREFKFALLSKINFAANVVAGGAAIGLAVAGMGVWALVAQRVLILAVKALLLWVFSSWRPRGVWRCEVLRGMAPYSLRLMTTDLVAALYTKVPQIFFGRIYGSADLGYYDQATKIKDLAVLNTMQSVQNVTFPALSKIADKEVKFAESYRQLVMMTAYVLWPLMVGAIAVCDTAFVLALGDKWLPILPYFKILMITGLFAPIGVIAYNILKVKSNGSVVVRLELIKRVVLTLIFAATIPMGMRAVAWGLVAMSVIEMMLNVGASLRYTSLRLWALLRALLPTAFGCGVMWCAIHYFTLLTPTAGLLTLLLQLVIGVVSYLAISVAFGFEAFGEFRQLVAAVLPRK